jgi:hypothetical protein
MQHALARRRARGFPGQHYWAMTSHERWMAAKETREHERAKLQVVEQSLADARAALERARLVAGDRACKSPLIRLEVSAAALGRELLVELQRLND